MTFETTERELDFQREIRDLAKRYPEKLFVTFDNEMTFEEKFPTMTECRYPAKEWMNYNSDELVVSSLCIEKHCLDKQRVRETIRKLQSQGYNQGLLPDEEGHLTHPEQLINGDELLSELGL
jgi:hypothetical protein